MTAGFRRTLTGRITASLDEVEQGLVRQLVSEVAEMVEPPPSRDADPLAVELGLEDLDLSVDVSQMGLLEERDPVLDRLFPPGYQDDAQAMEFRRFTELGLRQQKAASARTVLDSLTGSSKVVLNHDQALAWLTTLNDVRLAVSVRLGIDTDADHERLAALPDEDESSGLYHIYDFLTFLQETLVRAVSR
jgi:hypothetical protein